MNWWNVSGVKLDSMGAWRVYSFQSKLYKEYVTSGPGASGMLRSLAKKVDIVGCAPAFVLYPDLWAEDSLDR